MDGLNGLYSGKWQYVPYTNQAHRKYTKIEIKKEKGHFSVLLSNKIWTDFSRWSLSCSNALDRERNWIPTLKVEFLEQEHILLARRVSYFLFHFSVCRGIFYFFSCRSSQFFFLFLLDLGSHCMHITIIQIGIGCPVANVSLTPDLRCLVLSMQIPTPIVLVINGWFIFLWGYYGYCG